MLILEDTELITPSVAVRAGINRLKQKTYAKFEKNSFKFMRCVRMLPVRTLIFEINAVFVASQLHMAGASQENK